MINKKDLKFIFKRNLLNGKGIKTTLKGSSMLPFIKEGDEIEIQVFDKYFLDDIVVISSEDRNYFMVHRLKKYKHPNMYYIEGDNSLNKGEWFSFKNIFGKVTSINGMKIEQ